MMLLSLIFIFIYKLFDELQDESVNSHWKDSFFGLSLQFLNKRMPAKHNLVPFPQWGWARKWTWENVGGRWRAKRQKKAPWYYLWIYRPTNKEKFIYSSTILVWLTDGEHLFQLLKDISLAIAIGFASSSTWLGVLAFIVTYVLGFVKEVRK